MQRHQVQLKVIISIVDFSSALAETVMIVMARIHLLHLHLLKNTGLPLSGTCVLTSTVSLTEHVSTAHVEQARIQKGTVCVFLRLVLASILDLDVGKVTAN